MTALGVALALETSPLVPEKKQQQPITCNERCAQAITGAVSMILGFGVEAGVVFASNALLNLKEVNFVIGCGMVSLIVTSIAGLVPIYFGQDMLVQSIHGTKSEAYALLLKSKSCLAKVFFHKNPTETASLV